jgi:hypothetical protein
MATTAIPIEISRHLIHRGHIVLSVGGCAVGLTKAQALHAAVLLLEESASIQGRLTHEELALLGQLSKRLAALAAEMN